MRTEIKKLSEEGFGVAKVGRRKIYVPFTAIGDVVEIKKLLIQEISHSYGIHKDSK